MNKLQSSREFLRFHCSEVSELKTPKLPKFWGSTLRLSITALVTSFATGFLTYNNYVTNNLQPIAKEWLNSSSMSIHENWIPTQTDLDLIWASANVSKEIGYIIGAILIFMLANSLGRKDSLLVSCLVTVIGSFLCFYALHMPYFWIIFGRFLQGLSMIFSTGIGTLFLVEIAPNELRGLTGGMIQVFRAFGGMMAMVLSLPDTYGTKDSWTSVLAVPAIPATVQFLLLLFCMESPRHLYITKNQPEKAAEAIEFYQGIDRVSPALKEVRSEKYMIDSYNKVACLDIVTMRRFWRPFLLGTLALTNRGLTGMLLIQTYSTDMFIKAGIERHVAAHTTLTLGACHFVSAIMVALTVEKFGRKPLLIFGNFACCLTLFMISVCLYLGSEYRSIMWDYLTVLSSASFMVFYPLVASVSNIVTTEICHQQVRSYAFSVGLLAYSVLSIISTYAYPLAEEFVGRSWSFAPFCVCTFCTPIVYWIWLPETGGRTFENVAFDEDEEEFENFLEIN